MCVVHEKTTHEEDVKKERKRMKADLWLGVYSGKIQIWNFVYGVVRRGFFK